MDIFIKVAAMDLELIFKVAAGVSVVGWLALFLPCLVPTLVFTAVRKQWAPER